MTLAESIPTYRLVLHGTVKSGAGQASVAIVGDRLRTRSEAFGAEVVPGTLNVRIARPIADVLADLGEPHVQIPEPWSTVGTLRAWQVIMLVPGLPSCPAWITRGERSRARALETMAPVHWRTLGAKDGDEVRLLVP